MKREMVHILTMVYWLLKADKGIILHIFSQTKHILDHYFQTYSNQSQTTVTIDIMIL